MATSRLVLQYKDYDSNTIQTSFDGQAALDDGSDYAAKKALSNALETAVDNVVIGNKNIDGFYGQYNDNNVGDASSPLAQTNIQWQAQYSDNVNAKNYTKRIGTADLSLGTKANGVTVLDLGSGVGAALKTAWENYVVSPDGNATTLNSVVYVQ